MAKIWERAYKKARWIFGSRHTAGIIIAFWSGGVGVAIASYANLVPKQAFYMAYALLLAAFIWSIAAFLVWWEKQNPSPVRRNVRGARRPRSVRYRAWQIVIPIAIFCFFVFFLWMTWSVQLNRDLSEMAGILTPANAPNPKEPKCALNMTEGLTVYLGDGLAMTVKGFPYYPLVLYEGMKDGKPVIVPLITMDKDSSGNLVITADIRNIEYKRIAIIDRNSFVISESKIFKTSRERPDRHTIDVRDEYGNQAFYVRYLNPHAIKFEGILYYLPGEAAIIKGNKVGVGSYDDICIVNAASDISGLSGVAIDMTKPRGLRK